MGTEMKGQNGTMLAALKTGPRTATELNRLGIGRPNSRAAELRRHGFVVVCEFDKTKVGAARYVYRLLDDASIQTAHGSSGLAPMDLGGASSSSTRTGLSPGAGSAPSLPERGCCSTSAEESTAAALSCSPHADDAGRASRLDPALLLRHLEGEQMTLLSVA